MWIGSIKQEAAFFISGHMFCHTNVIDDGDATMKKSFNWYLTKPFKETDLYLSINLALQNHKAEKPRTGNFIMAKEGNYFVKLLISQVDFFESTGNYLLVYCGGKTYKCRSTTKEMLTKLPKDTFVQTHRAYLVNRSRIVKFNSDSVMVGNHTLPLSGKYSSNLASSDGEGSV